MGLNIDMILRHLIRYCLPVNMGQANLPDVKVQQYEIIDSNRRGTKNSSDHDTEWNLCSTDTEYYKLF